jgi:hypothetical protein
MNPAMIWVLTTENPPPTCNCCEKTPQQCECTTPQTQTQWEEIQKQAAELF